MPGKGSKQWANLESQSYDTEVETSNQQREIPLSKHCQLGKITQSGHYFGKTPAFGKS